jgi:soluble lytic murein transglycosylase
MKIYFVAFLAFFLATSTAKAKIYKYVDENGSVHFSNVPTDVKYKPTAVERRIKTYKSDRQKLCEPIIEIMGEKYSVDPALIKAVIKAESNFDPNAVSSKGAAGVMQLMAGTAKRLNVDNPFNIHENIEGGVKYLKYLLDLFNNNLIFAIAAYNAGENAVKKYQSIPPYLETQNYVRKVLSYYNTYSK